MAEIDFGGDSGGTHAGQAVIVGERSARDSLPLIQPERPFLLRHHPTHWNVVTGQGGRVELLPALSTMVVEPGVGNVDEYGNADAAITIGRRDGWVLIPQSACTPQDTPDRAAGYVRRLRVRGGWHHHTPWSSWRMLAGRPVLQVDEAGYHAWLRRLVAEGIVPAIDPAVVERKILDAEARLVRASSRDTERNATAARLRDQAAVRLEALQAARDAGQSGLRADRAAYLRAELERLERADG